MAIPFEDLPPEVIYRILYLLDLNAYLNARKVCRRWRQLAQEENLEHIQARRIRIDNVSGPIQRYPCHAGWACDSNQFVGDDFKALLRYYMAGLEIYPVNRIILCVIPAQAKREYSPDGTRLIVVSSNEGKVQETIIYDIANDPPRLESRVLRTIDRGLPDKVAFSTDNRYVAYAHNPGYVEVHKYHDEKNESVRIFSRQYPSKIISVAVSADGEVLFMRFSRLGGLMLVNLDTKEEMDVGHYRLDLDMRVHANDEVLTVPSGLGETVVFGKAAFSPDRSTCRPRKLWDYFKHLMSQEMSTYVPLKEATPLATDSCFFGFVGGDNSLFPTVVKVDTQMTESFDEFIEGRKRPAQYGNGDDDADDQPEDGSRDGHDDGHESHDEDDEDTNRLQLSPSPLTSELVSMWCISHDTTRLAMVVDSNVLIYSLSPASLEYGFSTTNKTGIPCRTILNEGNQPIVRLRFMNRDRLIVDHGYMAEVYELGRTTKTCSYSLVLQGGEIQLLK
jgi:hypothetical protein